MCGRFAFYLRPSEVRRQLEASNMPADEAPEDDQVRQTYNFAPGYFGLVYRADVRDSGPGPGPGKSQQEQDDGEKDEADKPSIKQEEAEEVKEENLTGPSGETHYKLQAMKWGLVPFWTKRSPDYGTIMRTINCRDDSLIDNRGMWTTMKKHKRCIVLCSGFYEWLKKNNGKEKIPHYIKRKDGQLLCFAGLWDCVKYEGSDEKHYTYTIITTSPNKQMTFLHDRMPVIFDNGSDAIRTWLDPGRHEWSKELQSLLKPYDGELDIYPVTKDVGKVGNNSPSFIIPINSSENKNNIANFFGNKKKAAEVKLEHETPKTEQHDDEKPSEMKVDQTENDGNIEDLPENPELDAALFTTPSTKTSVGRKRDFDQAIEVFEEGSTVKSPKESKSAKTSFGSPSPLKSPSKSGRNFRSATSNGSVQKTSPSKPAQGSQKITNFFGKK